MFVKGICFWQKNTNKPYFMKYLFLLVAILSTATSFGQASQKVDLTEYIREIQIWEKDNSQMTLAFWIPKSYWKISLQDNPQIPAETVDQLVATFEDYIFVCGLDVAIHNNGTASFTDDARFKKISFAGNRQGRYLPAFRERSNRTRCRSAHGIYKTHVPPNAGSNGRWHAFLSF